MATTDEPNAYETLGVSEDITEAQLGKAYRVQSLKVHPDRHRNDPVAGQKFHELTEAYELLKNPEKRKALDEEIRKRNVRKTKYAAFDAKRKAQMDELDAAERAFKRSRTEKVRHDQAELNELERIKEQTQTLRMAKLKSKNPEPPPSVSAPELGSLDTTVRLKFSTSKFPSLISSAAVVEFLLGNGFGPLDRESIVFSAKPSKSKPDKPPKYATALVPFLKVEDAFAAVSNSEKKSLEGVTVTWASGNQPAIVSWLQDHKVLNSTRREGGRESPRSEGRNLESRPAPAHPSVDFESVTMMKLRQAERDKLEREIKDAEDD